MRSLGLSGTPSLLNSAMSGQSYTSTATGGAPVLSTFSINANGTTTEASGSIPDWYNAGGAGADYEVIATVTAGTLNTGTAGSYLDLTSNQTWTELSAAGTESVTVDFTIRHKVNTSSDTLSFAVTIQATVV